MKKLFTVTHSFIAFTLLVIESSLVLAEPMNFDCDVPPDRYSSVSHEANAGSSISGNVQMVEMRSGTYLPVAGARWINAEGTSSVGFQLVAASNRASEFEIVLNVQEQGDTKRYLLAHVAVREVVPFKLYSENGKIVVSVGSNSVATEIAAFPAGKAMAFCSTAQFKFSDLRFTASNASRPI